MSMTPQKPSERIHEIRKKIFAEHVEGNPRTHLTVDNSSVVVVAIVDFLDEEFENKQKDGEPLFLCQNNFFKKI